MTLLRLCSIQQTSVTRLARLNYSIRWRSTMIMSYWLKDKPYLPGWTAKSRLSLTNTLGHSHLVSRSESCQHTLAWKQLSLGNEGLERVGSDEVRMKMVYDVTMRE